jgi:hypothetical protein
VVVGNPKAKNPLDRTPLGKFRVSEVVDDTDVDYMRGAAKFKAYQAKPDKQGVSEIGYYVHGFLPSTYGQGSPAQQLLGNTIGCVRVDMAGLKFKVGSLVIVR